MRSRSGAMSEDAIQRAVFQFLSTAKRKGVLSFHVPNGGKRSPIEAAIFKSLGVLAGVPDILSVYQGRLFALELKTEKGKLTPAQEAVHVQLREAGAEVATAYGLDAALKQLCDWGLVRVSDAAGLARQQAIVIAA